MRTTTLRRVTLMVALVILLAIAASTLARTAGRDAGAGQESEGLESSETLEDGPDAPIYSITTNRAAP